MAIVDRGRTVVSAAIDDLRDRYRRVQLVFEGDAPDARAAFAGLTDVLRVRRSGRVMTVITGGGGDPIVHAARGLNPVSVEATPATLKEIFLETVATEDSGA